MDVRAHWIFFVPYFLSYFLAIGSGVDIKEGMGIWEQLKSHKKVWESCRWWTVGERGWMSVHWIFTPPRTSSSFFGSCHQLPKIGTRGEPISPYLFIGTIIGEYLFIIEEYNIFVPGLQPPRSTLPWSRQCWKKLSWTQRPLLLQFHTWDEMDGIGKSLYAGLLRAPLQC